MCVCVCVCACPNSLEIVCVNSANKIFINYYLFVFSQSNEEATSHRQQVTSLHQELEESRRKFAAAQEVKDQLTAQLGGHVISLNQQLKDMREEHKADSKAKEEEYKLQEEKVRMCVCMCVGGEMPKS